MTALDSLIARVERATALDPVAKRLEAFWQRPLRRPVVTEVLSGTPLGHPLHPAAVLVPAGALLSATALDVLDGDSAEVRRLIGLGLLSAGPAALAGWSDWMDTEGADKRVGVVHALSNIVGLTAYAVSLLARRRGGSGRAASLAGAAALGVGGYLGGHLAYARGVGVDATAFQERPSVWVDVAAEGDVTTALTKADAAGTPVLLTRHEGQVVALAEHCTHRGGPLSEGERDGSCVVCPWHASAFDLGTGAVVRGPATRPQPRYDVRLVAGRVQVRRGDA
jgi:nitrite reductase/ring-hydroxylating ferredoxin subunit/uncharacterized membrane protein